MINPLRVSLLIFLFLADLALSGCYRKKEANYADKQQRAQEFTTYLSVFPKVELPIVFNNSTYENRTFESLGSPKFGRFSYPAALAFGQLPANGNYIAIVTLIIADSYIPVLSTYNTDGELIDKKNIWLEECGSDCGLLSCETSTLVRSDFTIYCVDTTSFFKCDTLDNETPGSYQYFRKYQTGRLKPNGRIELSKEQIEAFNTRKGGD